MGTSAAPVIDIRHKRLDPTAFAWKADGPEGTFRATLATFDVVDHDGDVTRPGAFPVGKELPISAYGHASWYESLPVGKGIIGADQRSAWVDGEFFLDTTAGRDTYNAYKRLGALGEWSYGFRPTKTSTDEADLAQFTGAYQILEQVDVFEASPVLMGAGIGVTTQWVKSTTTLATRLDKHLADTEALVEHARAAVSMRAKEGRVLSTANTERIKTVADRQEALAAELRQLLTEATPASDEDTGKSALAVLVRAAEYDLLAARMRAA